MTIRVTWRTVRRVLLVGAAVLGVLFVMTWYGRLVRCQAELAAWAQIRSAVIMKLPAAALILEAGDAPGSGLFFEAAGVSRADRVVRHYCDAPVWDWWR